MVKKKSKGFFDIKEPWEEHWQGMPEFVQNDKTPYKTILVHFKNDEDIKNFSKLINQKITPQTKFVWHPKNKNNDLVNKRCV